MVQGNDNNTIADAIVAGITPLIGQIAFLYLMSQMRSAVISFGRWGGLYASGTCAYRVCLGFAAIMWLPLDIDAELAKKGAGRPRHLGLSIVLSQSNRQIGAYARYTLRAWVCGYAIALLPADIDEILIPRNARGR